MDHCDKCGLETEELMAQPNGEKWCRNCHLGLGAAWSEENYNRLRIMYDKNTDFKRLRHRFWALGIQRRINVLRTVGYASDGETLLEKIERFRLYKIKEDGAEMALVEQIEIHEAEILAENEKQEYIAQRDIPTGELSGRVHVGRAKLSAKPTELPVNPWEESQK